MARSPRLPARLRDMLAADPSLVERIERTFAPDCDAVRTPDAAAAVVRPLLAGREDEALVVVALDRRHRVIDAAVLTVGSDAFTVVDGRQVFRWALTRRRPAHAVILAHNHPSGDPTPSSQDREVTERVARMGRVLGMPVYDHIVIGSGESYTSLAEQGCLPAWAPAAPGWTE
jgi:DNA repair protein RadC